LDSRCTHTYEFGDFRLDGPGRQLLGRAGEPVPLTAKAHETLLYLLERAGTVVDKQELLGVIWPDTIVEENNLNQVISALRRALGETRAEPHYIMTVPGRGYRFVARVRTQVAPATVPHASPGRAVAVLPFKPLVNENRDASLEIGMADTLIAKLSSIRELRVRPVSSVRRYAALDQDPLAAGRELRVDSVLEGSLQRWGDKIRVTVRLLNVSDGVSLWAGTFDEMFTDIFALQDAISEKVVAALALELSGEEKTRLTKHYTEDTEAYQLYLRGRYYWWKGAPEEFRKSRDYFHAAVGADPAYALGYCGLNSYYGFGAAWGMLPPREGWPKAEEAITKALELDDQLAEAHTGFAALKMVYYRDWAGAEREARRAVELNPRFEEGHYVYSFLLTVMGRFDEAVEACRRALKIDPFSVRINRHLGDSFYYARRYDEAIGQYHQTLELDPHDAPAHESLGDAYEQKGLQAEAVAEWQRALAGDEDLSAVLSSAYAGGGFDRAVRAVARGKLERLKEGVERGGYVPAIYFARAYARLNDKGRALRHLSEACGERNAYALLINVDPHYDSLRADPRFGSLLEGAKLPR
jgi:DNA-binding winged helix-turn-helix (wHTH) protein/Tfp pilus assembly protein PilF